MPNMEAVPAVSMRVLKISDTYSISGRSTLTYHIGCDTDSEVSIRVVSNTGNGQFNSNWVPLATIEKLLTAHPADKPLSSRVLQQIFRSKSTNSPAFLFAALRAEGLVVAGKTKDSGHSLGNIEAFKHTMAALITSDTNLDVADSTTPDVPKRKQKGTA